MARAIALAFVVCTSACAATQIDFHGERLFSRLRGQLELARVQTNVKVDVDPTPALVIGAGDQTSIAFFDDAQAPNSKLYVVLDREDLKAPNRLGDGQFIPYVEVRAPIDDQHGEAHAFVAICRGGRGLVRIDTATPAVITGHLDVSVTCRTYVDGYEREESTLELRGPFSAER